MLVWAYHRRRELLLAVNSSFMFLWPLRWQFNFTLWCDALSNSTTQYGREGWEYLLFCPPHTIVLVYLVILITLGCGDFHVKSAFRNVDFFWTGMHTKILSRPFQICAVSPFGVGCHWFTISPELASPDWGVDLHALLDGGLIYVSWLLARIWFVSNTFPFLPSNRRRCD